MAGVDHVIDYGQHGCQCPSAWWGVVPPYCPVHNPYAGRTETVTTTGTDALRISPSVVDAPSFPRLLEAVGSTKTGISDSDVERIAKRVVELLKAAP